MIRTKSGAAALSIASNSTLIAIKLAAGAITGSIAIITEALHSMIDLVASVNLLSQLPCLPEQHLLRVGAHPPDRVLGWARAVIEAHLEYLRRFDAPVALIADVAEQTVSPSGKVLREVSTLYGLEWTGGGEGWLWPLVPRKRARPHNGVWLRVVGIADLAGGLTAGNHAGGLA